MANRDYFSPSYVRARKACLSRDKKVCQMPGCKSKSKLACHHIHTWSGSPSLRFEANNLITLCKKCHESIKGLETHYVSLFEGIVRGNT